METWYKTSKYDIKIILVQVMSETDQTLLIAKTSWYREHRVKKQGSYDTYLKTFREARTYLMDRTRTSMANLQSEHDRLSAQWKELFMMEEPNVQTPRT